MTTRPDTGTETTESSTAFCERVLGMLNDAAAIHQIALGHRLGLFDALAALAEASSDELAARCQLHERYVREWLSAMTTAGIVDYDADRARFALPAAHAGWLTRAAAPDNLAVTAQFVPMFGAVFERIAECFRTGDGLGYGDCPGFHEIMAEDSAQTVVAALFEAIVPLVPGLSERLDEGIDVLDAGCGSGRALLALAEAFPRSRFTGIDLCAEALEAGIRAANRRGLDNVVFVEQDLCAGRLPSQFDLITTFDAVHDQADPHGLLKAIARALRPGGVYLMQEIAGSSRLENNLDHPLATFLYTISTMHCIPVSIGQGGPGLGTLWGTEQAEALLRSSGFDDIHEHRLAHDPFNVYFVARAGRGE